MAFSHVPLRRSVPAGVVAYLVGYAATFALVGSRTATLLESIRIDVRYGGPESLTALAETAIPAWKAVGWFLYGSHNVAVIGAFPERVGSVSLNVLARAGGEYRLLYLLPPVVLTVAGYLVARTTRTYGARGEQVAGASVALGYVACCVAGGLLFSLRIPPVGPDLIATIFFAGLGYPVVFGWLGGLAARWQAQREPEPSGLDGEAN